MVIVRSYFSLEMLMKFLIAEANLTRVEVPPDVARICAYTLMKGGIIDNETMSVIHRLRKLRHQVATWQIEPDQKRGADYYFATRKILQLMGRELHSLKSRNAVQTG